MSDIKNLALIQSAETLKKFRTELFELWESEVRQSIQNASKLSTPILTNTLPALYDGLIDILTSNDPYSLLESLQGTCAAEHGNERARLTGYDLESLISEYQIFRKSIFKLFEIKGVPLSDYHINIVTTVIDATIKESVSSFVLVQAAIREKFINALIHDLRGPLSTAYIAAEILTNIDDIERIHTLGDRVKSQLMRTDNLIQELLNSLLFQSGERLQFEPSNFDMSKLIQEIVEENTFKHGQRFKVEGDSVIGWWGAEPIKRAIENLITNAVKYGNEEDVITVRYTSFNERIFISVHNFGEPIPSDQLENVYKVFYRANAAKEGLPKGWGIGLSYVRSVAESHGGSIGAESTPSKGTTFLIDIPTDCRPHMKAITLE